MKTLILSAVLVVLSTLAFAQNGNSKANQGVYNSKDLNCVIYPSAADQVTLIMAKPQGEKVKLVVKENNENTLYQKNLKRKDSVKIQYDVSEFPVGEYTFQLVKDNKVVYSQSFEKSGDVVAFTK